MKKVWFILAMMVCVLASCSDGGGEEPTNPTPNPEEFKTEITIDSGIISNGLSFGVAGGEQSISFSVNANWTLSIASTTSGVTWCKASVTSGSKGTANVKFTVDENTGYDDRSVSVTIKAGSASKTFTITQKGADALLVTATKYDVEQEGGQIEIEVKASIEYQMEISEDAKSWITETSGRALTAYKHIFDIAFNEDAEKREGEITFKSGDKVETVKVYQAGAALILLSQNEYTISDVGETISVEVKSNVEYGVQMPDVDWIIDEASSRGMSSHTLKYIIAPNESYDTRSAEIIFYDKNSELKETLKIIQAQKDAIIISEKNFNVSREGGIIEVKINSNVDFKVQIPSDATWVSQTDSRALTEKVVYLKITANTAEEDRSVNIIVTNMDSQLNETIVITQYGNISVVTLKEAGTLKSLLGSDYLNIKSLKIIGPINGDDVYYLRKMLGGDNFSEADWGKLATLDLSEATIVEGGGWYYNESYPNTGQFHYTSNNVISIKLFNQCVNLQHIILPTNIASIEENAFSGCCSLTSIDIPKSVTLIGKYAFAYCTALPSINIPDGITSIGKGAFFRCDALNSIDIPNNVTSIEESTFGCCFSLTSIYIPNSVTSIGKSAFSHCNSLKSIDIPNSVISIGESAFEECSSLISIDIPQSVTSIGDYAFEYCRALTSVKIPDKVTSIGDYAFTYCVALTSIDIPNSVVSLGRGAFEGCLALSSATIGNNITSILEKTFYNCFDLTFLSIGKNVKTIYYEAFAYASIALCYCYATEPPRLMGNGSLLAFYKAIDEDAKLYVPIRCGSIYKNSWASIFRSIIEIN